MMLRPWLAGLFVPVVLALTLATLSPADDKPSPASAITWKRTKIDGAFRSEGAAVADVNQDGRPDVLIGDYWYEAPDWKPHEIRSHGDYGNGLSSYSECMLCWADDLNNDGWPD